MFYPQADSLSFFHMDAGRIFIYDKYSETAYREPNNYFERGAFW